MLKIKNNNNDKLNLHPDFEQLDHRLACGWNVELEGSGQRKRYLKSLKAELKAI